MDAKLICFAYYHIAWIKFLPTILADKSKTHYVSLWWIVPKIVAEVTDPVFSHLSEEPLI